MKMPIILLFADGWIKAWIASGDYTNDCEHFRNFVCGDQEQNTKFHLLKETIQEGLDSGISKHTLAEIWDEAARRYNGKQD